MDEQIACFRTAGAHLRPGGCFVIEVMVPALQQLPPGETIRLLYADEDKVGFDEYDVVSQRLISHHYRVVDGELEDRSVPFRYVWPSELDLSRCCWSRQATLGHGGDHGCPGQAARLWSGQVPVRTRS
jgi:hypothetical protein